MRTHEFLRGNEPCSESGPGGVCSGKHVYLCRFCKGEIVLEGESRFFARPSMFWPFCRQECLDLASALGDSLAHRTIAQIEWELELEKLGGE